MDYEEPHWSFPCTHCGNDWPIPNDVVDEHPGVKLRRLCTACGKAYDVRVPSRRAE